MNSDNKNTNIDSIEGESLHGNVNYDTTKSTLDDCEKTRIKLEKYDILWKKICEDMNWKFDK